LQPTRQIPIPTLTPSLEQLGNFNQKKGKLK
jgi:hypothetical protein